MVDKLNDEAEVYAQQLFTSTRVNSQNLFNYDDTLCCGVFMFGSLFTFVSKCFLHIFRLCFGISLCKSNDNRAFLFSNVDHIVKITVVRKNIVATAISLSNVRKTGIYMKCSEFLPGVFTVLAQ